MHAIRRARVTVLQRKEREGYTYSRMHARAYFRESTCQAEKNIDTRESVGRKVMGEKEWVT